MTFIAYQIVKRKRNVGSTPQGQAYDRASYASPPPQVDRAQDKCIYIYIYTGTYPI